MMYSCNLLFYAGFWLHVSRPGKASDVIIMLKVKLIELCYAETVDEN